MKKTSNILKLRDEFIDYLGCINEDEYFIDLYDVPISEKDSVINKAKSICNCNPTFIPVSMSECNIKIRDIDL